MDKIINPTTLTEAKKHCLLNERMVSEFAINLNIASFGLKGIGNIGLDKNHLHLQTSDDFNRQFNGGKSAMTKEERARRYRAKKNNTRDLRIKELELQVAELSAKEAK